MLSNGTDFSILEEDFKKSLFLTILTHCCLPRLPVLFGWVIEKWWFNRFSLPHVKWPWFLLLLRREIKCINWWEFDKKNIAFYIYYKHPSARFCRLLLLLCRFSRVRLCATPETAAHQAPPSLGFSRQEHWSGLPFPSPCMKVKSESEVTESQT